MSPHCEREKEGQRDAKEEKPEGCGKGGRDAGSGEESRKKDTEVWEKSDKIETS